MKRSDPSPSDREARRKRTFDKWQARGAIMRGLLEADDAKGRLTLVQAARTQRARMRGLARTDANPAGRLRGAVQVTGLEKERLQAAPVKAPIERMSFGYAGICVEVVAKRAFGAAALRFRLDERRVAGLEARTITVARWEAGAGRFRLVSQSGYDARHGHAYARITRPGLYAAFGVPRDLRLKATLRAMKALGKLGRALDWKSLRPKICELILCNPDVGAFAGGRGAPGGGFGPGDFDGIPGGGNPCGACLKMPGLELTPELDLIDETDGVPGSVIDPPAPLPAPCSGWENVGPDNVPGRITSLALDPTNGDIVYAGAADGGVFKSIDAGLTWSTVWHDQLSLSIGAVAVAPSRAAVVYAATGEWGLGAGQGVFAPPGEGVYRSDDAGLTWTRCAPIESRYTNAVAVHPNDAARLYVAGDLALHRSRDGGRTWDAGPGMAGVFEGVVSDVAIDPANPAHLLIGVDQAGLYESIDGGDSWQDVGARLPGLATMGAVRAPRIAIAARTGAAPRVVVKLAANTRATELVDYGRVFVSEDAGTSFVERTPLTDSWDASMYPYCNAIAIDPRAPDRWIAASVFPVRSTDAGVTWIYPAVSPAHPDIHAIVYDPLRAAIVYMATDGGVYRSTNGGASWQLRSTGMVTTQCYSIGVSQTGALRHAITTQDNACYSSASGHAFDVMRGPEGGWADYAPNRADTVYANTAFESLHRSDDNGTTWTNLGLFTQGWIEPEKSKGLAIAWNNRRSLLAIDRSGPAPFPRMFDLLRSIDEGATWQQVLAGPGIAITVVKFAPSDDRHAYAGGRDGRIWHSADGGATWVELPRGVLPTGPIETIAVDWDDPTRIVVALRGVGPAPVWRGVMGAGGAAAWFPASGGTPETALPLLTPTALALDPAIDGAIYLASGLGVYRSLDAGDSWAPFDQGLPNCVVSDMVLRRDDRVLYACTYGRGVYRRAL
jgi:photosystem II stability/assembly factor-like uncharacterized protein